MKVAHYLVLEDIRYFQKLTRSLNGQRSMGIGHGVGSCDGCGMGSDNRGSSNSHMLGSRCSKSAGKQGRKNNLYEKRPKKVMFPSRLIFRKNLREIVMITYQRVHDDNFSFFDQSISKRYTTKDAM